MKKMLLTITILVLVSVAMPIHAADLQAGWYAWPFAPMMVRYMENGGEYISGDGRFTTTPDTYGHFTVTGGPYGDTGWRKAIVTSDAPSVGPGDSLILPLYFEAVYPGDRFDYMSFSWGTEYEASQMRLELWRTRYDGSVELLWAENRSGVQSGSRHILYGGEYEGPLFYKVTVLPEPSSVLSVLSLLAAAFIVRLKGRRS